MSILTVGLAKSGTTGLYQTVKGGLQSRPECWYCLFEPTHRSQLESLRKYAPQLQVLTKIMVLQEASLKPRYGEFGHRVAIVRDPRDIVISYLLFRPLSKRWPEDSSDAFLDRIRKKENDPASESVLSLHRYADELGIGESDWSERVQQMWSLQRLVDQEQHFLIRYEDFVEGKLAPLEAYLDVSLVPSSVGENSWLGHITRSRDHGEWRRWFTSEDVAYYRDVFGDVMTAFGYPDDWTLDTPDSLDPALGSEYIVKKRAARQVQLEQRFAGDWQPQDATEPEIAMLRDRAGDGDPISSFRLARVLTSKKSPTASDLTAARHWAYWAAVQGHVPSMRLTARLYGSGEGGARNVVTAKYWREEAARLQEKRDARQAAKRG